MEDQPTARQRIGARFNSVLDRAESMYLKVLRAGLLILATLLILYAAGLSLFSLYRIAQSPDSVEEKASAVQPAELTSAGAPAPRQDPNREPEVDPRHRAAYDQFLRRYYQLFRSRFEPFRQSSDRQLSHDEFDDTFVNTGTRLAAVSRGNLNFNADRADLEMLLQTMSQAAALQRTQERLRTYQSARRVQVCRNLQRMRTTLRPSWDPYSTSCPNWYYDAGCAVTRRVETPYTERVCEMRFPEDTQSHIQIFRAYQNRFYELLNRRRSDNAAQAEAQRFSILQGISEGKLDLMTALQVAGGFLLLMFFFLLIAIERHQRRKSPHGDPEGAGDPAPVG